MAVTHVYVFQHAHGVKVGITRCSPDERREGLQREAGIPIEIITSWAFVSHSRARIVEQWIHHKLREHRTFGEWFDAPLELVLSVAEWAVADAPGPAPSLWAEIEAGRAAGAWFHRDQKRLIVTP